MPTSCASGRVSSRHTHCEPQQVSDCSVLFFVSIGQSDLVFTHLDICWCSPLDIGFIPSLLLLVVEQPLANAKATASPKQRLILVMMLYFVFIIVSFYLLSFVCCCCERPAREFIFFAVVARFMHTDVNRNSRPAFPRGLRRRAWTETFADSGRCKSRTSFHRVRRGERLLRSRSFRR
jgi:hypothetical protein